jgi:hypothetical protein
MLLDPVEVQRRGGSPHVDKTSTPSRDNLKAGAAAILLRIPALTAERLTGAFCQITEHVNWDLRMPFLLPVSQKRVYPMVGCNNSS